MPVEESRAKTKRRRTLSFAYLVLAVFRAVIPAVPWPGKVAFDIGLWLVFAAVMLILGAWQIDKAAKEGAASLSSRH